jgi:hypothetical protein
MVFLKAFEILLITLNAANQMDCGTSKIDDDKNNNNVGDNNDDDEKINDDDDNKNDDDDDLNRLQQGSGLQNIRYVSCKVYML